MKRVITSFKNANKDVLREISNLYPKGVEDEDLINFPTINGGTIRALEIEIGDSLYLVKMEDENYYRKFLAKDDSEEEDEEDDTPDDFEEIEDEAADIEFDEEVEDDEDLDDNDMINVDEDDDEEDED